MTTKSDMGLNGWDAVRLCDYDAMQAELTRLRALEAKVRKFCKAVEDGVVTGCVGPYVGVAECCHDCERCWLHHFGLEVSGDE